MHKEEEYKGMRIPEYRANAVPINNLLISPVRLTQRMVKIKDNTNPLTKKKIPKRWSHPTKEIDSYTEYNEEYEEN